MAALLQEPITAETVQAEMSLDVDQLLQSEPPPAQEAVGTRFDYLELEEKGFDKGAIQKLAMVGLVNDDQAIEQKEVPWWIKPETPQHVQNILRIVEFREKEKADKVTQHNREVRQMNKRLKFYEELVMPQCVEIVDRLLPRDANGLPIEKHIECDLKRLQLRTAKEKVKLQNPDDVFRQMEAWERELAEIEGRFDSELNPPEEEERRRLVDRCAEIEPDLNALAEAVRLKITTKEVFTGEDIAREFADSLPRVECAEGEEPALPFRVTVVTVEEYLGAPGWQVLGAHPDPAEGEEYERTVEATAVESFVANHPPLIEVDPETSEIISERPFELLGVNRIGARTTLHAG